MHLPCLVVLHGAQFYDVPVTPGDRVTLAHEPGNPVDPDAVQATLAGTPIGYLPARVAQRVLAEHGPGCRFTAEVVVATATPRRIKLRVHAEAPRGVAPASSASSASSASPTVPAPRGARTPARSPRVPPVLGEPAYSRSGRCLGVVRQLDGDTAVLDGEAGACRYPVAHLEARPESPA